MPAQFESVNSPVTRELVDGTGVSCLFDNDIVISGISGQFPESSNIEEFKKNLFEGINMITDDDRRWSSGIYGLPQGFGKLKDLSNFDASFFGVHPKQAHVMDPQLRIFLEATYEAILDAGINPSTIKGSRTGVFVGVSTSESDDFWTKDPEAINGYGLIGCCKAMFANRISFAFDFTGPSYAVDTACSSSLIAMHQAVGAIRSGECDAAIVGGLNLLLKPTNSLQFHKLGMLSQEGKVKAFDDSPSGYVRAEAIVATFLQKAKDARRVYATVIHTKSNTDGYKVQGITYPNGEIQNQLMREIYNESGVNPADVVYVEAHGTGTKVGDPEEVNSIDKLFCKDRKTSLLMGSVKSNMGHAEPASGLCSLAKVVIAMEEGVIPANLNYKNPNPNIPALNEGRIRVIDKNTPWNGGLVAINSFGFGGANVHILLRSNPKPKLSPVLNTTKLPPKLIAVSGRTKEAVRMLLDQAQKHRQDDEFLALLHNVHKSNIPGHRFRGYEILNTDGNTSEIMEIQEEKRPIWFVFSGMGTQWPGMARALFGIEIFQRSIRRSADTLKPYGIDLMDILMNGTSETCENVLNSFVSIAAIQIALVDVLTLVGIHPDGIVGHSVGELGCAYADGAFTAEQTILAAYCRGKAILDSNLELGAMAAVGLSWEEATKMCPPDISPACHNSADSVTISGRSKSLMAFVEELKKKDIFAKIVNSGGLAFHSKYIATAGPKLRASLDKIITNPKQRSAKWISSSIPETAWGSPLAQFSSSAYHVNNLLSPVLFQEAIAYIPPNAITIEIAPHCLLQAILRRSLAPTVTNIGLQKRDHSNNLTFLLSNVGKLYMAGAHPDIAKLYPPISFPVGRGTPMIGSLIKWDHSTAWDVANFAQPSKQPGASVVEIDLSKEKDAFLAGHRIDGRVLFPATGYIVLAWKTLAKLRGVDFEQLPVVFENIRFERATILPKEGPVKFSITIFEGNGDFEISEGNMTAVCGKIRVPENIEKSQLKLPSPTIPSDEYMPLNSRDIYQELLLHGYEYRGTFQGLKRCDNYGSIGELRWLDWISYMDTMLHISILCKNRLLFLPLRVQEVSIDPVRHKQLVKELSKDDGLPLHYYKNINILKSGGIEIRGLTTTAVTRRQHNQASPKYERYIFIPNENPQSLARDSARARYYAVTALLQIVRENLVTYKLKVTEVASGQAAEALIAPILFDVLDREVTLTVDYQLVTISPNNYAESLNQMKADAKIAIRDVNTVPPADDMHFVVAANVLSNQSYTILKNLAAAVKPHGFILLEETSAHLDLTVLKKMNLLLIGKQKDSAGKSYVLLRKREEKNDSPVVIYVTEKDLSWVETAKAAMKKSDSEGQEVFLVSQGEESLGLVGLMTCIRRESNGGNMRYVFIIDNNAPKFNLSTRFYSNQLEKRMMANVLKGGQWGTYRHLPLEQQSYNNITTLEVEQAYVNTLSRGDLTSLKWIESPLNYYRPEDYPNQTFCHVYYAPLNFRDVMVATGKLAVDALPGKLATDDCVLGFEFSGRDLNGRRVMGMVAAKALASSVITDPDFLWEVPDEWTLEQAATVPVVYVTSYYALIMYGRMKQGESVLIHAGSGGIGQAAINIALAAGCTVFTTVGTPEKRAFLKKTFPQLDDRHIGYSRDTSFEQFILNETHGRGVDIVLNSLSEEKLQASVRCLSFYGRFLEIGKYDLSNDSRLGMSVFLKNASFHGILVDMLYDNTIKRNSELKRQLANLLSEGIKNGTVQPLLSTVFSSQQIEDGFRYMASGKHMGKVLIKIRDEEPQKLALPAPRIIAAIPRAYMNPNKSYVIVGGLGGFGLEMTTWMIARGAKFIVLVSRSGIKNGYQALCMRHWRENGAKVVISTTNPMTLSGAQRLIEESNQLAPIGGIFNLAAVLRDCLFENMDADSFREVMLPKVDVTRYLDTVSRKSCPLLDYFVVFSSITSGRGNIGQTNYGFANSAMERMMEQRQALGLPGLAIQWGVIGEVGLLADKLAGDIDVEVSGTLPQSVSSCLTSLDILLQQPEPVLASAVAAEKKSAESNQKNDLVEVVANILGIKDINSVNHQDSLADMGMDSLMGTEIKQILERNYDIVLSPQDIRNFTIAKLQHISAKSETTEEQQSSTTSGPAVTNSNAVFTDATDMLLMQWPSNELLPKEVLVRLKTKSTKEPVLFIVHAIEGLTSAFEFMANEAERSIWGLQSIEKAPYNTIPELAEFYVKTIKKVQKKGPYHLAGYSFGACVAFEMALQLESGGQKVILNLLDGSPMYVHRQIKAISKIDLDGKYNLDGCAKALAFFSTQFNRELTYIQTYSILAQIKSEEKMFDKMIEIIGNTPFSSDDLKTAGHQILKKFTVASIYNPSKKFTGPITLIKSTDIFLDLDKDYGLSKICVQPVKIEEVHGNHRSILLGESAKKIAELLRV